MRTTVAVTSGLCLLVMVGCCPQVEKVVMDPSNPNEVNEYQLVKVEGKRMIGSLAVVNGTRVSAARTRTLTDPAKLRYIVIPEVTGGLATASVKAASAACPGGGNSVSVQVQQAAPPAFNVTVQRVPLVDDLIVVGTGVFPAAGPDTDFLKPFKGPRVTVQKVAPQPGPVVQGESTFDYEDSGNLVFWLSFPPGTFPSPSSGETFELRIENSSEYDPGPPRIVTFTL